MNLILPLGGSSTIKDLVFSILTKESPLKLIELTNYIRKRYGRSTTFQAVRKATLQLVEDEVLVQDEKEFSINRAWVTKAKNTIDQLYEDLHKTQKPASFDAIGEDVSVFSFSSLNELMKFWQQLIDDWFKKFKTGDSPMNCYQAAHVWEGLLHLDAESKLMGQLKDKGIKSHILSIGNTLLDKNIRRFYTELGVNCSISPSHSSFDKAYYVGTYGELIVQTSYPEEIVKELDMFFAQNTSIETLNLQELSRIVNQKIPVKLTVMKNLRMAEQINESILKNM